MRFLGRKSSNSGPKAICRKILNKFIPSAGRRSRYGGVEDGERLTIPTKLIKLEDVATSNHMSLVELVMITVKNRQSKKCRTKLMISDTSVELLLNKQKLFSVGLDQVVTCFSLPSERRVFALVYKKDGGDGYCCASLMLNDALTSLSGWEVWEMLIRKLLFITVSDSNRRFASQTQPVGNASPDTFSVSSLADTLSFTSTDSLTCSQRLGDFSISTLTSITPFGSLDSRSLNAELAQSPSSISDSALSSSSASAASCQNDTDSLISEAGYSCSDEGEEAYLESNAEESASDNSNEALNCSGCEAMSISSRSGSSDLSVKIGAGAACESDDPEDGSEEESESDLQFNSDTSQWTPGSEEFGAGAVYESDIDDSDNGSDLEESESDLQSTSDGCQWTTGSDTDSDSHSSRSENSHSDESDETDPNNRATDSDSDSGSCSSCGDDTHGSNYSFDTDSLNDRTSDSEGYSFDTDSLNDRIADSDSDSHISCGENTHNSDCDESDETDSNDRVTDSDCDSCSCSSCCCSCEECCNHDSDSDVCYDSESYSSSGEDSTDSDYDGDDEDDNDSVKCQRATRINSQCSNTTLKLIRIQNVGLVMMAVSKPDLDSVSGRESVEASSSLQMLKRLGKEISFTRVPCWT